MKYAFWIALSFLFLGFELQGQVTRELELEEVLVKDVAYQQLERKMKTNNVHHIISPTDSIPVSVPDSIFYATPFHLPGKDSILLSSVSLKIKPFDTSVLGLYLLVYQEQGSHTVNKVIQIDGSRVAKRGYTQISVFEQDIVLRPGEFYLGYCIRRKIVRKRFKYRVYVSTKGEGALLYFDGDQPTVNHISKIPYVIPFRLSYTKY